MILDYPGIRADLLEMAARARRWLGSEGQASFISFSDFWKVVDLRNECDAFAAEIDRRLSTR